MDVDPVTGNIDPGLISEAVHDLVDGGSHAERWVPGNLSASRLGRGKAILPVDVFGQPADMDAIVEIAYHHGLVVIEDSCAAIGSEHKGRKAGSLGDVGVFAFYPNKQMTTGEGGMLVADRDDWDALFRSLRNQGRDVFGAWLNHTRLGYNYRLDEMSAGLGLAQLKRLEELMARRARVAHWYNKRLSPRELIETPTIVPETTRMSWFVYVVRIKAPASRDRAIAELKARGIASRPYFAPIHLQPFHREGFGYRQGDYPVAEKLGAMSLALPFSSVMTEAQVDHVCEELIAMVQRTQRGRSE